MTRVALLALLLVAALHAAAQKGAAAPRAEQLAPGLVHPGWHQPPRWFKQSFLDLREDVREAAAQGRRLLLYFHQDGCPYCKKLLDDNFGQRDIAERTQRHFDVVAINLWGDLEVVDLQGRTSSEKRFARELKVQFTPTLLMLDERGDVVLRLNGYRAPHEFAAALDFAGRRLETQTTFAQHLAALAPQPASGVLHELPGALPVPQRLADALRGDRRPLLVLFEQRVCSACDELHRDILKRAESRALLGKLQVAVLDQHSGALLQTPDGAERSAPEWARALGVQYAPSLLFFDAAGREVFRSEGYLKAFHVQSMLDYVASGAYLREPQFQRWIEARADALRRRGKTVELMK